MNLPSIAGVLGFKDFTNQLNNANAGVKNAVGLVNDWAKMAAQQNQAEKQAQAQRDFTAEQNQINHDFQDAQQQARFDQELGMFEKQQERQLQNEARKFRFGINDLKGLDTTTKTDVNDMNEQKLRAKVQEIKEHPEYFDSDEDYNNAITQLTRQANKIMIDNRDMKAGNQLDSEFKELRDGDFRTAQLLSDWAEDNKDAIEKLRPEMKEKIKATLERKQREAQEDSIKWEMLQNSLTNARIGTKKALQDQADAEKKRKKKLDYTVPGK